jgi:hypothetical protein
MHMSYLLKTQILQILEFTLEIIFNQITLGVFTIGSVCIGIIMKSSANINKNQVTEVKRMNQNQKEKKPAVEFITNTIGLKLNFGTQLKMSSIVRISSKTRTIITNHKFLNFGFVLIWFQFDDGEIWQDWRGCGR